MTTGPAPMCLECERFREGEDGFICGAYPDGIPEAIIMSTADHRKPYEGDGGQTFIPIDPDHVGELTGNPLLLRGAVDRETSKDQACIDGDSV